MTGGVLTTSMVGRTSIESCACLDVTASSIVHGFCAKSSSKVFGKEVRVNGAKGRHFGSRRLYSDLIGGWQDSRQCSKALLQLVPAASGRDDRHGPLIVDDLGGQYEESFADVQKHLLDYFTYKAVRTVLAQLSEMNPHQYAWFYNFVVNNKPQDSKYFIRLLVKERQELGERVMVTRLHLFNKWVKKYNHAQLHKAISDQNLELLRERLIQTVKFTNSMGDDIETTSP